MKIELFLCFAWIVSFCIAIAAFSFNKIRHRLLFLIIPVCLLFGIFIFCDDFKHLSLQDDAGRLIGSFLGYFIFWGCFINISFIANIIIGIVRKKTAIKQFTAAMLIWFKKNYTKIMLTIAGVILLYILIYYMFFKDYYTLLKNDGKIYRINHRTGETYVLKNGHYGQYWSKL